MRCAVASTERSERGEQSGVARADQLPRASDTDERRSRQDVLEDVESGLVVATFDEHYGWRRFCMA